MSFLVAKLFQWVFQPKDLLEWAFLDDGQVELTYLFSRARWVSFERGGERLAPFGKQRFKLECIPVSVRVQPLWGRSERRLLLGPYASKMPTKARLQLAISTLPKRAEDIPVSPKPSQPSLPAQLPDLTSPIPSLAFSHPSLEIPTTPKLPSCDLYENPC